MAVKRSWFPGALGVGFVVSRVLYWIVGLRYDVAPIAPDNLYVQVVDLGILEDRLFETIANLHIQPPLFNLALGLALKFSPVSAEVTFHLLSLGLGLVLTVALYRIAFLLGLPRRAAIVLTLLIAASPPVLIYENWAFYTYFNAVGMTVAAAAFLEWCVNRRPAAFAVFAAAIVSLVASRSLYHPVFAVAALALALLAGVRPEDRRRVLGIAAGTCVVVFGLLAHYLVSFGTPSLSSWGPVSVSRIAVGQLHPDQQERLAREGRLHPAFRVGLFDPWSEYAPLIPCTASEDDPPILSRQTWPNGKPNLNYSCYLERDKVLMRNNVAAVRAEPLTVLAGQVDSWHLSMASSSTYGWVRRARLQINWIEAAWRRVVLAEIPTPRLVHSPGGDDILPRWPKVCLTILAALGLVVWRGVHAARRARRGSREPTVLFELFAGFVVLWVFVVGNTLELGENNRFRFDVEPLMMLLLGVAAARYAQRREAARPSRMSASLTKHS